MQRKESAHCPKGQVRTGLLIDVPVRESFYNMVSLSFSDVLFQTRP